MNCEKTIRPINNQKHLNKTLQSTTHVEVESSSMKSEISSAGSQRHGYIVR